MMKYYFRCKSCNTRISSLLSEIITVPDFHAFIDKPLLQSGQYCIDTTFYISLSDKLNLHYHKDESRRIGCCGPTPEGLPNLVCSCTSEIGRETSDCLTPHFVTLDKEKVHLISDDNELLKRILQLSIHQDEKYALEVLLLYGQIDDLSKKLAQYADNQR